MSVFGVVCQQLSGPIRNFVLRISQAFFTVAALKTVEKYPFRT